MIGCIEDDKRNKKYTISREKIEIKDKKKYFISLKGAALSGAGIVYSIQ